MTLCVFMSYNVWVYSALYAFCFMTLSHDCTVQENLCDAAFYRHVIVFTPFAATALGLASICLILYHNCKKKLQVDPTRANIHISE